MAEKNKSRPKPTRPPEEASGWARPVAGTVILLLVFGAVVGGLYALRAALLASPPYSRTLARIRLSEVPKWMPADIAHDIWADIQSGAMRDGRARNVFEDGLAKDVHDRAAANPWIATVRRVAKRGDGTVLVEVDYRTPFALVRSSKPAAGELVVVDATGVVLPLSHHRVKPNALITIGDVADRPPAPGRKWEAPDLADGLKLLELIKTKPYASEITTIDVRNYAGRISQSEPHLRMYAQVGRGRRTDIRFGRLPAGEDYCVSPQRKLAYLDKYYKDNGRRLAGVNTYIDLRYDKLHVSVN